MMQIRGVEVQHAGVGRGTGDQDDVVFVAPEKQMEGVEVTGNGESGQK
jgi:hypothetical protein